MSYSHSLKRLAVCLALPTMVFGLSGPTFSMDKSAPLPFTCQSQYTGLDGDFTLPWFKAGSDNALAVGVVAHLVNAREHGLNPADYQSFKLAARMGRLIEQAPPAYPGATDAKRDQLNRDLTRAAICYLQQVHSGQLEPEMVHAKTMLRPKFWRATKALKDAWKDGQVSELFKTAAPQTKQYRWLRQNLALVRRQMKDQPLRNWGQTTPAQRIAQIELSMERIRWLPRENGQRRIEVNIPEFKVRMTSRGRLMHHSKVVVGKPGRSATPLFAGRLSRVDLNPSWYVPHSIAKYKLLPKIRKDPEYVSRKNMVFTERDGTEHSEVTNELLKMVARNKARIEQRPGDDNALGRYKFVLPNHRAIFMHDTNQKELFDRDVRAYSSGCVRIENADHLARMVLLGTKWNKQRIGARIWSGKTKAINARRPTLVVLHYQTARAFSPRKVKFFDDLYGMDAQAYAFVGRWSRAFAPVQKLAGR